MAVCGSCSFGPPFAPPHLDPPWMVLCGENSPFCFYKKKPLRSFYRGKGAVREKDNLLILFLRRLFLLEVLQLCLGLGHDLLNGGLFLGGNRCGTSGETDIQTALLAVSCILVNDSLLGCLVESGDEALKETLDFLGAGCKCCTQLLLIGLEAAQNADIAGVALVTLTGALDSGAAFFKDGGFCSCHGMRLNDVRDCLWMIDVPEGRIELPTKGL